LPSGKVRVCSDRPERDRDLFADFRAVHAPDCSSVDIASLNAELKRKRKRRFQTETEIIVSFHTRLFYCYPVHGSSLNRIKGLRPRAPVKISMPGTRSWPRFEAACPSASRFMICACTQTLPGAKSSPEENSRASCLF